MVLTSPTPTAPFQNQKQLSLIGNMLANITFTIASIDDLSSHHTGHETLVVWEGLNPITFKWNFENKYYETNMKLLHVGDKLVLSANTKFLLDFFFSTPFLLQPEQKYRNILIKVTTSSTLNRRSTTQDLSRSCWFGFCWWWFWLVWFIVGFVCLCFVLFLKDNELWHLFLQL